MSIGDLLAGLGIPDAKYEKDEYDDPPTYLVSVPGPLLGQVKEAYFETYYRKSVELADGGSVRFVQATPTLVPANPGDIVRVYCERETEESASPVGVVTSVQEVGGKPSYGCSFIQLSLGDRFNSDVWSWHLSAENYAGYHSGFLRVIPPEELPDILKGMIERGYAEALKKADAMKLSAERSLGPLVEALQAGTLQQVVRWNLSERDTPLGVKNHLPQVYRPDP